MTKILYVLHSGVRGGTFLTNKDLMKNVEKEYDVFLLGAENDFFRLYSFSKGKLEIIKEYSRYPNTFSSFTNSILLAYGFAVF